MGLFDSIRNAVGGSDDGADDGADDGGTTLLDSTTLDPTDFRERAERLAEAEGLDFSLSSLADLDRHVTTLESRETADDATAATTYTERTVDFGSYLGEVLVRAYDGAWVRNDGWGVSVAGPDDEVTVSVFEVAVRSLDADPVFAAVVERLEAELSLDATDPDTAGGAADESVTDGAESADDADDAATGDTAATASETDHGDDAGVGSDSGDLTVDSFGDTERESESTDSTDEPSAAEGEVATTDEVSVADESHGATDDSGDSAGATADADDSPADTDTAVDPSPTDLIGEAEPDAADADDHDETGPVVAPESSDGTDSGDESASDDSGGPPDVTDADPTAGDGLRAEYAETAQDFASFWSEHDLDFSPASLGRLDDLVDGEWEQARFRDATFGSDEDFDDRAFTSIATELGSYFGEVLVRDLDGEWTDETDHVAAVLVPTGSGPLAVPVFQVAMNSLRQSAVLERSYDTLLEDIDR